MDSIAGLDGDTPEDFEAGGLNDRQNLRATLFGESDSEEEAEPSGSAGKDALARLAARKRQERQEAEAQEEAARSAKRARQAPPSPREAAAGAGAGGDASEDEGAEEAATAADAAFIDDEGAPPADEAEPAADSESEDERGRAAGPAPDDEAEEEEDEFEKMFASKGRRRSGARAGASKADVDAFMGMMEAAAMTDLDANREGKPAVHKLKMLAEAEDMLDLHDTFLDGGLLGVLKAWLEPMPDGSLPNARVRAAVLHVLAQLPIDVTDEGRKDQLKRSGVGKVVLFLCKLPDESTANRRAAKALVERWSRPIFDQYRERRDAGDVQERELELLQARRRRDSAPGSGPRGQGGAAEQGRDGRALRPGDPGFRWHASIPEPARLDYVRRPTSQVAMDVNKARAKPKGDKMDKRLKMMNRPGRAGLAKAAKVSVEGRGM